MHSSYCTSHPFVIPLLACELDNDARTGLDVSIEDDISYRKGNENGAVGLAIPPALANPADRVQKMPETFRDRAGEMLTDRIAGVPYCHPLLKDADERRATLKAFMKLHASRIRPASKSERPVWNANTITCLLGKMASSASS